jgi:uncharacterized protein (TIGR02596 family)
MKAHSPGNHGSSLVELFIVTLIIVVMAVFGLSNPSSLFKGSQLSQAEHILTDQLKLARQQAVTRNHSIEVRFIRYGDPESPGERADDPSSGFFRTLQLLEVLDNGSRVPLDKPQVLPQGIVMNSGEYSTLLHHAHLPPPQRASRTASANSTGGDPSLPRGIDWNYDYRAFRFLPDGGTNLNSTNGVTWCVTLHDLAGKPTGARPPNNFATLQLDPVVGTVRPFRPSVQ